MPPTVPFDEIGIILSTLSIEYDVIFFSIVLAFNALGLYIADRELDKKEMLANPNGKGYVFEWSELVPYALASAVLTMAILSQSAVSFWFMLFLSWVMGMIFRPLLPVIMEAAMNKTKGIIEVMFGTR